MRPTYLIVQRVCTADAVQCFQHRFGLYRQTSVITHSFVPKQSKMEIAEIQISSIITEKARKYKGSTITVTIALIYFKLSEYS